MALNLRAEGKMEAIEQRDEVVRPLAASESDRFPQHCHRLRRLFRIWPRIASLLVLSLATQVFASMQRQIPLQELYEDASVVAVVEITERQSTFSGGESCGAHYTARVMEGAKNAGLNQRLEFGFLNGLKVGAHYLVLLEDRDRAVSEWPQEFQARCRSALPGLALVGHMRGAMEVLHAEDASPRHQWLVSGAAGVLYPAGVRGVGVHGERQWFYTDLISRMKPSQASGVDAGPAHPTERPR